MSARSEMREKLAPTPRTFKCGNKACQKITPFRETVCQFCGELKPSLLKRISTTQQTEPSSKRPFNEND